MSDNSSNSTRIAKNTIFMYIRMLLTTLIALFTVRVVINTLGVEDYGIYGAIGGVVASLTVISSVLANASQRFFAVEIGRGDDGQLSKVFNTTVIIYMAVSLFLVLIAETIGLWFVENKMVYPAERADAVMYVYQFALASFIVSLLANPYTAIIIAKEKMNLYAYLSILDVVLKLAVVYILYVFDVDKLKLYATLLFFMVVIVQSIYIAYCVKRYPETRFKLVWDKNIVKSISSFSGWTLWGSLAYLFNTQGLNIILNLFFGPIVNAAYSLGNQVKSIVVSFSSNFFVAVRPALIKSYAAGDKEYTKTLFYFSSKTIFALLFVIMLPILIEIDYFLKLWLGTVGDYMGVFVRLMLLYTLIIALSDPITAIVQAADKVKSYYLYVDGFTLLTLPLSYLAYKFGMTPEVCFYISIVIFIFAHFIRLVILRSITGYSVLEYCGKLVAPFAISSIIAGGLSYSLYAMLPDGFIYFVIVCAWAVICATATVAYIVLTKDERKRIISLIKKKIMHKKL